MAGTSHADAARDPVVGSGLPARAVRHTVWNLAGILLPLLAGLVTIPVLTRQLGVARFGVLGLAWILLEYFSLFDAGLGRATVRAVAAGRRLLQGRQAAPGDGGARSALAAAVTGAVTIQLVLGGAAGLVLALIAPYVAGPLLRVPDGLRGEAAGALRILGLTVPLLMLGLALRGLLEAAERFDLSNGIRIPMSIATFVVPALVAAAGGGLEAIMVALLVLRFGTVVVLLVAVRRAMPGLAWVWPRQWDGVRELATFGGWVAVSNFVSPLLIYLDRLAVGALLGVAALGYYTAPFEASLRLLVLPAALVTALYPMASALVAADDMPAVRALYAGAVRALGLAMTGVALVGVVFAPELLGAWLGADYASHGSAALRLLCVGVLVNAVVHVPFAFMQAAGRPDVMARFHLVELAVHVPAVFLLVGWWGITGAAAAWALRALLDAVLVFSAAHRVLGIGIAGLARERLPRALALAALLTLVLLALRALLAVSAAGLGPRVHGLAAVSLAVVLLAAHAAACWRWLFRAEERRAMLRAVMRR